MKSLIYILALSTLILPGSIFSRRDTHFRLSYAAHDDVLERGIKILRKLSGGQNR